MSKDQSTALGEVAKAEGLWLGEFVERKALPEGTQ